MALNTGHLQFNPQTLRLPKKPTAAADLKARKYRKGQIRLPAKESRMENDCT